MMCMILDGISKHIIITAINNALGYYPMSWGILKSYNWKIKHEFNYYK